MDFENISHEPRDGMVLHIKYEKSDQEIVAEAETILAWARILYLVASSCASLQ
jgi:hypothetical protein